MWHRMARVTGPECAVMRVNVLDEARPSFSLLFVANAFIP